MNTPSGTALHCFALNWINSIVKKEDNTQTLTSWYTVNTESKAAIRKWQLNLLTRFDSILSLRSPYIQYTKKYYCFYTKADFDDIREIRKYCQKYNPYQDIYFFGIFNATNQICTKKFNQPMLAICSNQL